MKAIFTAITLLIAVWALPTVAASPVWTVQAGSSVGFTALQAGAPVSGVFEVFDADIRFDSDDPAASTARVTIDIASVNSQSSDRDSTIRSSFLFDVATWPTAVFEATTFESGASAGQYVAVGTLTMRDVTQAVSMPFQLSFEGDSAHAEGALEILRLDYGVGQGMWTDTSVVANEVTITIDIQATR